MRAKQPVHRYIVALILGFILVLTPDMEQSLVPEALLPLVIGVVLGFVWPTASWRWGLWIAAPMLVFLLFSVLSSGYVETFLRKDLLIFALVVAAGCAGSFGGAWYKQKGNR